MSTIRPTRLYIIIAFALLVMFVIFIFSLEGFVEKEELLKLWETKPLFFTSDKEDRTFIPYDLVSDAFYVKSSAQVYDMNNFDSTIIKDKFGPDPKFKAPNGPRIQPRLVL